MILVNVSYLGYQQDMGMLIYGLKASIPSLFCRLAVFSVMEKYGEFTLLKKDNKLSFPVYFMMTIPHSFVHGFGYFSTIIMAILFGLPFALLQKKRDLTSAMISHVFVDAVRFTLFGFLLSYKTTEKNH